MGKFDAAEKVINELKKMSFSDLNAAFDDYSVEGVLKRYSLDYIEERINSFKKEKEGIRIGDEVECTVADRKIRFIVFAKSNTKDGKVAIGGLNTIDDTFFASNGWCAAYEDAVTKTGEYYDLTYLLHMIRPRDKTVNEATYDTALNTMVSKLELKGEE